MSTPRVCSFESRRAQEMASLIRKCGGEPILAPALKEVPVEANTHVTEFGQRLLRGDFSCLIFLTGVGTTALFDLLWSQFSEPDILHAISRCRVVARGPKPTAVLRSRQIRIDHLIPEPNTWREIIAALEEHSVDLNNLPVAIQEYGGPSTDLTNALSERGANVTPVPVYRWELPDDVAPLEQAIHETIAGRIDILLWTSAQQVNHVVEIADRLNLREPWLKAASSCFVGSIGPVATERLLEFGLTPNLEPTHPKMGHLVKEALTTFISTR